MPDDVQLLEAYARRGDVESLSALVARHAVWLTALLRGHLRAKADVDDAFQDVWTRVIRSASGYRGGNVRAYLARIAQSVLVDRLRRSSPTVSLDRPDEDGGTPLEDLPDTHAGTREDIDVRASSDEIQEAVRDLPEGPRRVLLLRLEAELPFRDIAEELGIPVGTALTWMHVAAEHLRRRLRRRT